MSGQASGMVLWSVPYKILQYHRTRVPMSVSRDLQRALTCDVTSTTTTFPQARSAPSPDSEHYMVS